MWKEKKESQKNKSKDDSEKKKAKNDLSDSRWKKKNQKDSKSGKK